MKKLIVVSSLIVVSFVMLFAVAGQAVEDKLTKEKYGEYFCDAAVNDKDLMVDLMVENTATFKVYMKYSESGDLPEKEALEEELSEEIEKGARQLALVKVNTCEVASVEEIECTALAKTFAEERLQDKDVSQEEYDEVLDKFSGLIMSSLEKMEILSCSLIKNSLNVSVAGSSSDMTLESYVGFDGKTWKIFRAEPK